MPRPLGPSVAVPPARQTPDAPPSSPSATLSPRPALLALSLTSSTLLPSLLSSGALRRNHHGLQVCLDAAAPRATAAAPRRQRDRRRLHFRQAGKEAQIERCHRRCDGSRQRCAARMRRAHPPPSQPPQPVLPRSLSTSLASQNHTLRPCDACVLHGRPRSCFRRGGGRRPNLSGAASARPALPLARRPHCRTLRQWQIDRPRPFPRGGCVAPPVAPLLRAEPPFSNPSRQQHVLTARTAAAPAIAVRPPAVASASASVAPTPGFSRPVLQARAAAISWAVKATLPPARGPRTRRPSARFPTVGIVSRPSEAQPSLRLRGRCPLAVSRVASARCSPSPAYASSQLVGSPSLTSSLPTSTVMRPQ